MSHSIDARGLTCPAPVLLVKDTIEREQPRELTVQVDNEASRENVCRFLGSKNYTAISSGSGTNITITAHCQDSAATPDSAPARAQRPDKPPVAKSLVLIASDRMGSGDDELGAKLMISYIKTLKEMGDELWRLVFVNSGVKLVIDGSPVLAELQDYEQQGLTILACGTCLSFFNLMDAKKVAQTTNMLDIVTAMQLADKVISLG